MTSTQKEKTGNGPETNDKGKGSIQQYITFLIDKEVFAAEMEEVQEIIRVPQTVRVPLASPSLQGLANLRGKTLAVFSLRSLLGLEKRKDDEAARVLVVEITQPLGFIVDHVSNVIHVESDQIEEVAGIQENIDKEILRGVIKNVSGFSMVMILNFSKILQREFASLFLGAKNGGRKVSVASLKRETEEQTEKVSEEVQLVSFSLAQQEYAIDISHVKEIVQIPSTIVRVPHTHAYMLGIMNLRDTLIPLIDVRNVFELEEDGEGFDRKRVVLITTATTTAGLVVDGVSEVIRISKEEMEPLPSLLSTEGKLSDIGYICRLEGGKRLISILLVDQFMKNCKIQETMKKMGELDMAKEEFSKDVAKEVSLEEENQMVIFRLADCEFGVPIEHVQEIVRIPEALAHIPKAPEFVEGVINLRGTILPIIDLRKRLGFTTQSRNDRQRIIVFLLDGIRTGFIVDAVLEVKKIPKASIEPAPQVSGEQAKLLRFVANLEQEKRIIQLLEPRHLLEEADRTMLSQIDREAETDETEGTDR